MKKICLSLMFLFTIISLCGYEGSFKPIEKKEAETEPLRDLHFKIWTEIYVWHVEENGLGFIYEEATPLVAGQGITGDLMVSKYDWHPGFRVCFGYDVSPDFWAIEGQYANYNPNDRRVVDREPGEILRGAFPHPEGVMIDQAKSYLSLTCHFGDLLLKKKFTPGKQLDLFLICGITGAWMCQNWQVHYYDENNIDRCFKPKWHYKGGGIRLGTDMDWLLGKGFSLMLKGSFASMMGNYDNRTYAYDTNMMNGQRTVIANTHYDDFRIVSTWKLAFGPSWQWRFKDVFMKLFAGYELNTWYNLSEIHRQLFYEGAGTYALPYETTGVISTQGATFGIYFDL